MCVRRIIRTGNLNVSLAAGEVLRVAHVRHGVPGIALTVEVVATVLVVVVFYLLPGDVDTGGQNVMFPIHLQVLSRRYFK